MSVTKIGITGGIGSGKTVIASLLSLHGIPVYIADEESKKLTDSSPVIRKKLTTLFGDDLYTEGRLNRSLLASYIFNNPDSLAQVNAIIHPEVARHFDTWVKQQQSPVCAMESAILFESGFNRMVDVTLLVLAPLEVRIERALQRDKAQTRDKILHRIHSQMPDEAKISKAHYIIYNNDTQAIIPQVDAFLAFLRTR